MQKKIFLLIYILLLFPDQLLPQNQVSITSPRLSLQNNFLVIEYDILNYQPADLFSVWLEVTDSRGNPIKPSSITGDCGEKITGGMNRKINWDFKKDNVFSGQEIYVEVFAVKMTAPVETRSGSVSKYVSKSNVVMSSLILPGWGQSKIKEKKPYWIIGLSAYGSLAGSLIFNRLAISTYDDYLFSNDIDERNSLYNKSVRQDNTSEILVYTAAGIWVVNMIWALASPPPSKEKMVFNNTEKIRLNGGFDPFTKRPVIILSYRF